MDQLPLRLHQLFRALDMRFEPYVHKNDNPSKDVGEGTRPTIMPYGHTLPQVTGPGHILAPDRVLKMLASALLVSRELLPGPASL